MVGKDPAKRPAHEVILEKMEVSIGLVKPPYPAPVPPLLWESPFAAVGAIVSLCSVLEQMVIPEKHLDEVLAELKRIRNLPHDQLFQVETFLAHAIKDLESRQAGSQPAKPAPVSN